MCMKNGTDEEVEVLVVCFFAGIEGCSVVCIYFSLSLLSRVCLAPKDACVHPNEMK